MNKTIQHLAEICKEHRFEEKLLFVPSYCVGHQIGEDLEIAVEVTKIRPEKGLRTSSSASRPAFMQRTEIWGEQV